MAGMFKTWDPHNGAYGEEGLVAETLREIDDKKSNVIPLRAKTAEPTGEVHEGLVLTKVGDKTGVFLQVGPEAFLDCGALVMGIWEGKRIRVTVDVLGDTEAAEMALKEAA